MYIRSNLNQMKQSHGDGELIVKPRVGATLLRRRGLYSSRVRRYGLGGQFLVKCTL